MLVGLIWRLTLKKTFLPFLRSLDSAAKAPMARRSFEANRTLASPAEMRWLLRTLAATVSRVSMGEVYDKACCCSSCLSNSGRGDYLLSLLPLGEGAPKGRMRKIFRCC